MVADEHYWQTVAELDEVRARALTAEARLDQVDALCREYERLDGRVPVLSLKAALVGPV